MFAPYGYSDCKLISTGFYCKLYKGVRTVDNQAVVLKVPKSDPPKGDEMASLDHEQRIMELLKGSTAVPRLHARERYRLAPLLVIEWIDHPPLSKLLKQYEKFELKEFLAFSLATLNALESIHSFNVIHKDITENNILYDRESQACKIIDFGISIPIHHQKVVPINPEVIEGTLAYMSPEQTGRVSRGLDYRSDYYSLGITFYRTLSGRLPFTSKDPMTLVYDHISSPAKEPNAIDPTIPDVLSEIIMKLIAKDPEDRYQSIAGIRGDLLTCVEKLEGNKIESFTIATQDTFERFEIPEKVYGRESEIEQLTRHYEEAAAGGSSFTFIAGYSGVGKSSLVNELHNPISNRHGWLVVGKFEQFKRNIPYLAFNQAFDDFLQYMFTQPDKIYYAFRDKVIEALGSNAHIIIEAVPNLEKVIGKQAPSAPSGVGEIKNRFAYAFQKFIECLATEERPIALFLDDLQWADIPSIRMVKKLLEIQCPYLHIICGYRDNSVDDSHPLGVVMNEAKQENYPYHTLHLQPLKFEAVNNLVAETLRKGDSEVKSLAEVCFEKSGGNPFFLIQLLEELYKKDIIVYDWSNSEWIYDIDKARSTKFTHNVVIFMKDKICELPSELQSILEIAACIGSKFSFKILEAICPIESEDLRKNIEKLLNLEFITCFDKQYYNADSFYFVHDSIHQAAHELLEIESRVELHIAAAKHLEKITPKQRISDVIFTIADHYNSAIHAENEMMEEDYYGRMERRRLVKTNEERDHIAQINFLAAKVAKEAGAYEVALNYCQTSMEWNGRDDWEVQYDFLIGLYSEAMECAYLSQQFDLVDTYEAILSSRSKTVIDRFHAMKIKGLYYNSMGDHEKVVELLLTSLRQFGYNLPKKPSNYYLLKNMAQYYYEQKRTCGSIVDLAELPIMDDRIAQAVHELIAELSPSVYLCGNKELFLALFLLALRITLKEGNSVKSPVFYSAFGLILIDLGLIESGYQYGNLSLTMANRFHDQKGQTMATMVVWSFILHWKEDLSKAIPELANNFALSLEAGNNHIAVYAISTFFCYYIFSGHPISDLKEQMKIYKKAIFQIKNRDAIGWFYLTEQTAMRLAGKRGQLFGYKKWQEPADNTGKGMMNIYRLAVGWLFRDFERAEKSIEEFPKYEEALMGHYLVTIYYFFRTLTYTEQYEKLSFFERYKKGKEIKKGIKRLKKFSRHAPMNHLNKYHLLLAEWHRIHGRKKRAETLYLMAMKEAEKGNFHLEKAIANELFGRMLLQTGDEEKALEEFEGAISSYKAWGATNKILQLKNEFPKLHTGTTTELFSEETEIFTGATKFFEEERIREKENREKEEKGKG